MTDRHPLMIFAAGLGTRMGALTRDRPKPLLPLAGRTLIERAAATGREAGCAPIVANAHYLAHRLAPVLADLGISMSDETDELLDTGGGLKAALPLLGDGHMMTLNPDVAWAGPNPLAALASADRPGPCRALLLLTPRERARGYRGRGDFDLLPDGRIVRGSGFVYTGAQLIDTGCLGDVPDRVFSLNRVWSDLAGSGALFGHVYPGLWCDAGTPEGLAAADAMLREAAR